MRRLLPRAPSAAASERIQRRRIALTAKLGRTRYHMPSATADGGHGRKEWWSRAGMRGGVGGFIVNS